MVHFLPLKIKLNHNLFRYALVLDEQIYHCGNGNDHIISNFTNHTILIQPTESGIF